MKIRKSLFSLVGAMLVTFGFTACTDWGDQDPAAGNQVYPERQVVNTYDFEYSDDKPEFSDMVIHNEVCEVVNDDYLGSNVLHLNGTGAAKIANPFNNVKLQNGAAITFAVKVDCAEGEEMDLKRPIFSFGSDDAQGARFYFTPNGQLVYTKPGQLQSLDLDENDPDTYKTGILTPNEWHFVALQLGQKGYQLYVDGKKSLSGYQPEGAAATTFSYQTLLDSIQALPYLYIGTTGDQLGTAEYGSLSVDNVTLIRNQMNERDWNKTVGGNGGGSEEKKVYVPVGAEDCSTAWWSAFSDYFTIPANQTFHTKFINHTKGDENYHNWLLIVCNDRERVGDGYSEYFVLRSDLWGWGNADYNAANLTNEGYGDWDDFKRNMEGAEVDMTVEHRGGEVYVTAIATCKDGTVYKEMYHQPCDANDNIRAFLTCEGSYLQIDAAETYIGEEYAAGSKLVGPADCTAGWWTAFSDFYPLNSTITEDCPFVIKFVNNNTGNGENWNNWVLVCSTEALGGASYFENYVLRADAYGWFGAGGNTNENTANLDFQLTSSFDWTTFKGDMHGATCELAFTRSGNSLTMNAKQRKEDGSYLPDYQFKFNSMRDGTAGIFLTAELASLDILKAGYFPYYKLLSENQ